MLCLLHLAPPPGPVCLSHCSLLGFFFILFPYCCCSELIGCCTRVIFHHISKLCRTSLPAHHPILAFQFPLRQKSNTGIFGGRQLREAGDLQLTIHGWHVEDTQAMHHYVQGGRGGLVELVYQANSLFQLLGHQWIECPLHLGQWYLIDSQVPCQSWADTKFIKASTSVSGRLELSQP